MSSETPPKTSDGTEDMPSDLRQHLAAETQGTVQWLTVAEAATRAGTGKRAVRYWIEAQKVRRRKVGNAWQVAAEDVDVIAATEGTAEAVAEAPAEVGGGAMMALATRAAAQALQGFMAHLDGDLQREAEERRAAVAEAKTELRAEVQRRAEEVGGATEAVAEDLATLAATVQAQADELARLRRELQEARRPWWHRIIGRRGSAE